MKSLQASSGLSDERPHLLFVCTLNLMRSATAQHLYKDDPRFEVKSAGTHGRAETVITEQLIRWADWILVMESHHGKCIRDTYPETSKEKRIICLGIPDEFDFMEPALQSILKSRVEELV